MAFFSFLVVFFSTGLVQLLQRRSSTEILPDYWGTFCAGVCPRSVFSFLVAAGFEPTSLSLRSGRFNRYPILTPHLSLKENKIILFNILAKMKKSSPYHYDKMTTYCQWFGPELLSCLLQLILSHSSLCMKSPGRGTIYI